MVKNKKFFEAEIVIFYEVLSLNPKNHIQKKECSIIWLIDSPWIKNKQRIKKSWIELIRLSSNSTNQLSEIWYIETDPHNQLIFSRH